MPFGQGFLAAPARGLRAPRPASWRLAALFALCFALASVGAPLALAQSTKDVAMKDYEETLGALGLEISTSLKANLPEPLSIANSLAHSLDAPTGRAVRETDGPWKGPWRIASGSPALPLRRIGTPLASPGVFLPTAPATASRKYPESRHPDGHAPCERMFSKDVFPHAGASLQELRRTTP
jgi:hypothetical protein